MKLEHGKTYVTQGGWVVEIIVVSHNSTEYYFATQRTSVGNSRLYGIPVAEYVRANYTEWAKHCGWQYRPDGSGVFQTLEGIGDNDLKIIGEYPFELKNPPEGYKWAGGFPKVETPVEGNTYLTADNFPRAVKMSKGTDWIDSSIIGKRRILLEKAEEPTVPKPEHSVEVASEYYVPTDKYSGMQARYFVKREGVWYNWNAAIKKEYVDGSGEAFWQNFIAEGKIKPSTKEEAMARIGIELPVVMSSSPIQTVERDQLNVVQKLSVPKEEKMNSSFVNVVKSVASRTLSAANHFYVEPAKIIGGYVKRSIRYAVFFGTLTGIIYGINDPTSLKKKVASCMPKITIEAPDALR